MTELTAYEERALREIATFKRPVESKLGAWWRRVQAPVEQVADLGLGTTTGAAVVRTVQDVLDLIHDGASWTVRTGVIHGEFQRRGLGPIQAAADIHRVGLHEVDRLVSLLGPKYQALAVAEGAGSGVLGGIALGADVALLVGLTLRAVGEYATYYGFTVSSAAERAYVMSLLSAASLPSAAERQGAYAELTRLATVLADGQDSGELESQRSAQLTKKIAEALAVRLLKAKLAQLVPLAGVAIAGGYNVWLARSVTGTAFQLYRERFLIAKHGEAVLSRLQG